MDTTNPTTPLTAPTTTDVSSGLALEARSLVCSYGSFDAVRGIDLEVHRGELFALLGTNGAGKTTTLETLEGHRRPSGGSVRVFGRDPVQDRRTLASRIGVMFQESGVPDDLTPREMLGLWRDMHPSLASTRSRDETDALERVGLDHRGDVRARQLSGGERRRLDLALALATDPELLFLDEPTTGMDPEARERTWELIRELRRVGTTIVLTTHYLEEAEALADRIAIMHEGRIAASGSRAELIADRAATVRCRLPSDLDLGSLPALHGDVEVAADGPSRSLTVATTRLQDDLTTLLGWAATTGLELDGLSASEPSLRRVFHDVSNSKLQEV